MFGRSVSAQRFHVAGIGCAAIENLGRPRDLTHDFGQGCVFDVGQSGAMFGRELRMKFRMSATGLAA